jgi:2-dehydropantoate 2-reductase
MRIAIMGAGGLGAYFGLRLAHAGNDVVFVARGARLGAMKDGGLRLTSELGDAHLLPVEATDDQRAVGEVDLVVFAVKLFDSETAAEATKAMIGPRTTIVSLQNGIEKDELLARIVGREHVIGGVSYIAARIKEPGVIEHTGRVARVIVGELGGELTDRVSRIVQAFSAAGVDARASSDIVVATWEKFVFLVGVAGITSLLRASIGQIRENAEARSLLGETMLETVNVGRADGIDLDPAFVEAQLRFCDTLPETMRASMAVDLERGRRLELPWLNGAVVRLGRRTSVETPVNGVIARALAIYAGGTNVTAQPKQARSENP